MKRTQSVFLAAFSLSLIIHLLIVLAIYYPGNIITIMFSGGMFFSWLYVSNTFKDLSSENNEIQFSFLFQKLPSVLKYVLIFFALYAFINFVITLSFDSGAGWVDFKLGHDKLKGISGFWMFFYFLAYSTAYLKNKFVES